MKLEDKTRVVGNFSIITEYLDGTKDIFEEKNMIMDLGRYSIAGAVGGIGVNNNIINKFVLGTLGYNGDVTTPIEPNTNGFEPNRTNLFSEEAVGYFTYPINFTPTTNGGLATLTGLPLTEGCTVKVTQVSNVLTYEIYLGVNAANNGGQINYTEAAFYCGSNIFSMKTFPVKTKDNSGALTIVWSFTF